MHQPASAIIVVADALVPNWPQGINNHHADFTVVMMSYQLYYTIWIAKQKSRADPEFGVRGVATASPQIEKQGGGIVFI